MSAVMPYSQNPGEFVPSKKFYYFEKELRRVFCIFIIYVFSSFHIAVAAKDFRYRCRRWFTPFCLFCFLPVLEQIFG